MLSSSGQCFLLSARYERASKLLTPNRTVEDWRKLLGDVAAVTAMLDRILHHGHVLKFGPRSWRTKAAATATGGTEADAVLGARVGRFPLATGFFTAFNGRRQFGSLL